MIVNKKKKKRKKKENLPKSGLADCRVKLKESEKKDKYIDFARELKKTMEHESDGDTNCNLCDRYSHQRIGKETGGLGDKKTSRDHPNYITIKIRQNTEKSPGD